MISLALRLARRDLRGGWRNFRLALAWLALGVATIAGIGSFGAGLVDGLRDNGRTILGGDVALLTTMSTIDADQAAWLPDRATMARTMEMNAMAQAGARAPLLVSLKAVDGAWPLYGAATLDGGDRPRRGACRSRAALPGRLPTRNSCAHGPEARRRLHHGRGGTFRLSAILVDEPDRASAPFQLGPRRDRLDRRARRRPGSTSRAA